MKEIVEERNRAAWDERVRRGDSYVDTATEKDFQQPLKVVDPFGWLPEVAGQPALCLAAGGGRHGVLLAAAGARVTVVDLSAEMLALDRKVARERGLTICTVQTSMTDLRPLGEPAFTIVVQPVSSCYTPDLAAVYREVARVSAAGALYISHHKQPSNLQGGAGWDPRKKGYLITEPYYRAGPLPAVIDDCWHREKGTVEFLHRWENLVGDLCRAGFVVEDLAEPRHGDPRAEPGSFRHRSCYLPPYLAIKARKVAR